MPLEVKTVTRLDIPASSPNAIVVLEKVRDAIDRNDLPAATGFALADRVIKLDCYNRAVEKKSGDRASGTLFARRLWHGNCTFPS